VKECKKEKKIIIKLEVVVEVTRLRWTGWWFVIGGWWMLPDSMSSGLLGFWC